MALREEWEKQGNWLFRWRSYLPVIVLALAMAGMGFDFKEPSKIEWVEDSYEVFCMFISFLGLGVRILTVGYKPKGTSGGNTREQEASVLNTTGTYSVVRHPLYLGNCIIWLGISLFFCEWWMVVIISLVFWLYYERIMFAEEEFLRRKFGDEYVEWAAKTPAFIPKFSNWKPWEMEFSWKKVLGKEYAGFFAIIAVFTLLDFLSELFSDGHASLDFSWGLIFISGAMVYVVLRGLKKLTKVFYTENR